MIPSNLRPPARADVRPLVLLLILVAFVASIAWTAQLPAEADTSQSTAAATAAPISAAQITPTPTRFPEELTNQDQTNGIVLGSTILVLIIVIGTLTVIRHGEQRPK
ncbi:MAG TPA: hypothetical protein VFF68_13085 [Anaerolineaceae bacterium]|nr:hypothetical protein [Anaerolineaceae bacterium]